MKEIKIPVDSKKSIRFFSKYHNADLYLNIKGFFLLQTENLAVIHNMKRFIKIIYPDLISALQASLCLTAEKDNIYQLLADRNAFDMINSYMSVCLENNTDAEFKCIVPEYAAFDNESLAVIRISEQMKNPAPEEVTADFHIHSDNSWKCRNCGCLNSSNFCMDCGVPKPETWKCICGTENDGAFCTECGTSKLNIWKCSCGSVNKGNFCPVCGKSKTVKEA